jgi:hypothetical protein
MTDAEKQAANRVVAEARGWRVMRHPSMTGHLAWLIGPDVQPKMLRRGWEFVEDEECESAGIPDIFANTEAGAWAREQARKWLLSVPVTVLGEHFAKYDPLIMLWTERAYQGGSKDNFGWCVEYHPHRKLRMVYGLGQTIEEATAAAIHAAVVALGAGGDE